MTKQPNVLLLIVDQLSLKVCDGSGNYKNGLETPAIDSIAKEGVRFENCYSSFPLCCPARASMFTGMMSHHHNIVTNEEMFKDTLGYIPRREELTTLGKEFKNAGYKTAYFGKEHAGGYGWDHIDEYGSMKYSAGGMLSEGSAFDQIFTKDAIGYLKQQHDEPFYMTLSLINPHDTCKVLGGKVKGATFADTIFFCRTDDEPYLRYQTRAQLPENFDVPYLKGMFDETEYMYEGLEEKSIDEWQRYISTYNLLLEKTDWYIQLVLETLKSEGLEENTIVIFTTDHGEMLGSHRLISKFNFYEESVRTHTMIKYPNHIQAGLVDKTHFVNTIDLMPTILDLCDLPVPNGLDGKSLKPLCQNKEVVGFEHTFSENLIGKMIRFEQYKYIQTTLNEQIYHILFDLEKDPCESNNVFNQPGYHDISNEARHLLEKWMNERQLTLTFEEISA